MVAFGQVDDRWGYANTVDMRLPSLLCVCPAAEGYDFPSLSSTLLQTSADINNWTALQIFLLNSNTISLMIVYESTLKFFLLMRLRTTRQDIHYLGII